MPKVALVETKPSKTNFKKEFDDEFEFDQYQLCSDPYLKKVLKRDCDIEIDVDAYDWLILVGSDALKYFTSVNSVTEYSGKKVEEKFLPVINPAMLAFKPEVPVLHAHLAMLKKLPLQLLFLTTAALTLMLKSLLTLKMAHSQLSQSKARFCLWN